MPEQTGTTPSETTQSQPNSGSRIVIILSVLAIVLLVLLIAVILLISNNSTSPSNSSTSSSEQNIAPPSGASGKEDESDLLLTNNKEYADNFVTFKFPLQWEAKVVSGENIEWESCNPDSNTMNGVDSITLASGENRLSLKYSPCPMDTAVSNIFVNLANVNRATVVEGDESIEYTMGSVLYYKNSPVLGRYIFVYSTNPRNSDGTQLPSNVIFSMPKSTDRGKIALDIHYSEGANIILPYMGPINASSDQRNVKISANTSAKTLEEAKAFVEDVEKFLSSAKKIKDKLHKR